MSSNEIPKNKIQKIPANKNNNSINTAKKNNDLTYIKNDIRDIKIDIREFRADIYCEMKDASTVYSILKNGDTRVLSSIQTLMDVIEENSDNSNKKLEQITKELKKTRIFLILSILTIIILNLLILIY
ncbi:hypothetical protein [Candidatus Liberibacter americanus]|nr:hypothetical protein [Candidatus Liberibacter americanus]EMS36242.1 hypothetical protein G653_02414 [Candidatus Liberibacter americanus PW_SP]